MKYWPPPPRDVYIAALVFAVLVILLIITAWIGYPNWAPLE